METETSSRPPLAPGRRILMGPGPSDVDPRVTAALATTVTGHLDPFFLDTLDHVRSMLKRLFKTENETTLTVPGTGTAGMEACIGNLLEPGDTALIGVNGYFGNRMADMAERAGAEVVRIEAPWGVIVPVEEMVRGIERHRPKVAAIVHAETSTGIWQPVEGIGAAARDAGSLFVLDCVTSLGGCPVEIDEWMVDAAYSGSQKCLSCPPGIAPVTFSERAMDAVRARKTKPTSFYLDVGLLDAYARARPARYHHTAPISMVFAFHEALRAALEEGLPERFERHRSCHEELVEGLGELGLEPAAPAAHRLWMLNPIRVPEGVVEAAIRKRLLEADGLEIGAGLGPLAGKIWRVGIMGASADRDHVRLFLDAMGRALAGGPVG